MSAPDAVRASGQTQVAEVTRNESQTALEPIEIDAMPHLPEEGHQVTFRTPGFSRMRTDWHGPEAEMVHRVLHTIEERIKHEFLDAFEIMNDLFEIVRTPEVDDHGNPRVDQFGFKVWQRRPNGTWDEDWSRLTRSQKENFLFEITTRLFSWEQRAADRWTESMLAKAAWEERFSLDYQAPHESNRPTIEDRTSAAKVGSADERYLAIFMASYSRRADSIARSMGLLGQRIKDSLSS